MLVQRILEFRTVYLQIANLGLPQVLFSLSPKHMPGLRTLYRLACEVTRSHLCFSSFVCLQQQSSRAMYYRTAQRTAVPQPSGRGDLLSIDGSDRPHLFAYGGNWYLQPPHGRKPGKPGQPVVRVGLSVSEQRTRGVLLDGVTPCFRVEHEPYDPVTHPAGITEAAAWALPQEELAYNNAGDPLNACPIRRYLLFKADKDGLDRCLAGVGWATFADPAPGDATHQLLSPNQVGVAANTPVPACVLDATSLSQTHTLSTPNYGAPTALRATEPLWMFDGVVIRHAYARAVWEALDEGDSPDPILLTVVFALVHVTETACAEPSIVADMLCQTVVTDASFGTWFGVRTLSEQSFVEACLEVYSRTASADGLLKVDAAFSAIDDLRSGGTSPWFTI